MKRKCEVLIILFIIILTILLAGGRGLTETNFSVLGSRGRKRFLFLLWGAVVGSIAYLSTGDTADQAGCRDAILEVLLSLSLIIFFCGIGLPYRPKLMPGIARIHVYLSMGGVVVLVCGICRLLDLLERQCGAEFRMQKIVLVLMQLLAVGLYCYAGMISSLLELYALVGGWFYLAGLRWKIKNLGL